MRKFISIVLTLALFAALLAGCSTNSGKTNDSTADQATNKISVVATIFAPYDFARQIAGDKANVTMLLPPGSESHSYEPTPQDIITIQNCDVFIYVGGDSDAWITDILSSLDMTGKQVVTLMDCVETVEEEIVEGMEDDEHDHAAGEEEHHEEEVEYDEHVWTSPRNAKLIVQKISDAMQAEGSADAQTYQTNTTAYLAKLDELDAKFQNVVNSGERTEIIMGDRFPFRYFADAYGLEYYAAFAGCSTETEASPATVAFLINKATEDKIPVIFHLELSNEKIANTIAEGANAKGADAKVLLLHSCHNVTKDDFNNGATYLSLMENNVQTLKEALS
ncbi:MAG: metal ABC transporter substrate-binding protein [Oscillospiraceae bacterium]|jgi:zinc transport system substrate-binding protein|nr:metal ABC transporter substrate-binding protein [Oscillospiraceae bacterium]